MDSLHVQMWYAARPVRIFNSMPRVLFLLSDAAEEGLAAVASVAGEGALCSADISFGVALFLSGVSECSRDTSSSLIAVDDCLLADTASMIYLPLKKTCSVLVEDFFHFA